MAESSETIVASTLVSVPVIARSRSDSGGPRRSITNSFRRSSSTSGLRRRRTSGSMSQSGTENVAQAKGAWVPTNLVLTETKLYYDMDGVSVSREMIVFMLIRHLCKQVDLIHLHTSFVT